MGRSHIAPAIHFRHEPANPVLREPLLGEHTADVLERRNDSRAFAASERS
jgi:hypothetical protein